MTMQMKVISGALDAASDRVGHQTRVSVVDILQQIGAEDHASQHLLVRLEPAVNDIVQQVQNSFRQAVVSRIIGPLRKAHGLRETAQGDEDITTTDTDNLINLCVPQTVMQDINGPDVRNQLGARSQHGGPGGQMSQIFRDSPLTNIFGQQQVQQQRSGTPPSSPFGSNLQQQQQQQFAASPQTPVVASPMAGNSLFSPTPGTPAQLPNSASPYAAPNSPLLADLYQMGQNQGLGLPSSPGLTSMPSLGMGMGLGLDFGSLQLRDNTNIGSSNGALLARGGGPGLETQLAMSTALDSQGVALLLQQQQQVQQAQQQEAQLGQHHTLVGGGFARMSDTGSHCSTTSHTSYGEALRSLVSPHDPVFVPSDIQQAQFFQQQQGGMFGGAGSVPHHTIISSSSPAMSTTSPMSVSPSQTFSPSRPLNLSSNNSSASLSSGSAVMVSAGLPLLVSSPLMTVMDPCLVARSEALVMDSLALQAANARAGRPPAPPRPGAKAPALKPAMGRPIEVPGRFKALPPAIQAKILTICQSNPVVSVKDFDEKVVSKLSMLVEGWGTEEALSMLTHLEQRMRSKQGTMKNGPGYLDVAVCTHIDMLKAQGACPKTMKIEDYAKHCLSPQVFSELREAVAANRWLQWDHFDQGIIQLIKKLPHDGAVEKLQEMSYHSFKNVDNIKGCIMSILNSKIREDRRNRLALEH